MRPGDVERTYSLRDDLVAFLDMLKITSELTSEITNAIYECNGADVSKEDKGFRSGSGRTDHFL
jgi:hypothetical protein